LDATVHQTTAQRYQVRGYPTIKYFGPGSKSNAEEFDGGRTASDIVQWAMNKFAENAPAPPLVELTEQAELEKACEKQLCLIAFLPTIYECQSKCRNDYLAMLKKLGDKFKVMLD
jgi:protein disulfide-isomerase A6